MHDVEIMAGNAKAEVVKLAGVARQWEARARQAEEQAYNAEQDALELRAERDALARQLADALDHVGRTRAVLYRIVDIWDGPQYRHQMKPAVDWARQVLDDDTQQQAEQAGRKGA